VGSLADGVEDRDAVSFLATATRRHAPHDLRAVVDAALGLKAAFATRNSLNDDTRIGVNQNRQGDPPDLAMMGDLKPRDNALDRSSL
jgi:hypothetical protein